MAGYAIECALKACIAKRTRQFDFPDKKLVEKSYSHDLERLLDAAELTAEMQSAVRNNQQMEINWSLTTQWSESSRYELARDKTIYGGLGSSNEPDNFFVARMLVKAIESEEGGILPWIKLYW